MQVRVSYNEEYRKVIKKYNAEIIMLGKLIAIELI
jgi:hypothetical protein